MTHRVRVLHPAHIVRFATLLLLCPASASAHQLLGNCVQHRVSLSVDPVNIDVEVELTFTDMRAMAERRRIDADRDWSISREEAEEYAHRLEESQQATVGLVIDGKNSRLVPLHDPQVELGDSRQVAPAPLLVRLFYFARTPAWLKPGSDIVLTDRLWPEAPAVLAMTVAGHDGVRVSTTPTDPFSPAVRAGSGRPLRARCLAVPKGGVGKPDDLPDGLSTPAVMSKADASAVDSEPLPIRAWLVVALFVAIAGLSLKRHPLHRQQ